MIGVSKNLRLRRVALAPVPFLLQFIGEGIGILHALDVATGAGIPVPVPGAADIAALLIDPDLQPLPAQPVQHVHPGKTGADHDGIVGFTARGVVFSRHGWQDGHHFGAPVAFYRFKQHSTRGAKAQETKRQGRAPLILPCGMKSVVIPAEADIQYSPAQIGPLTARRTGSSAFSRITTPEYWFQRSRLACTPMMR